MPDATLHAFPTRLAARKQGELIFLKLEGLLAFEASDRLTHLHHVEGRYCVDLSLNALAAAFGERVLRVHRNWLIAPERVQGLRRTDGELHIELTGNLHVPVARDRARAVRKCLLRDTIGLSDL